MFLLFIFSFWKYSIIIEKVEVYAMRFEKATRADRVEVLSLYARCRECPGCTWPEDYPNEITVDSDIALGALNILREKGRIAAAMSAGFENEHDHFPMWSASGRPGEISRVAVHPDFQGRRLGSRLMQMTLASLRGKGYDAAHLLVSPGNPSARRLYERNGFVYRGYARCYGQIWLCMERKW